MNKRSWSAEDLAEYELLVDEALTEPSVRRRCDIFLAGLDDAVQAHRFWGLDVLQEIRDRGAERILTREHAARRPPVAVRYDGQLLGMAPRVLGTRHRDESGAIESRRTLFDVMTWEELRAKLTWFNQQITKYRTDARAVAKLLSLESLVSGAATPAEACARLGTSVEDFLASEAAS